MQALAQQYPFVPSSGPNAPQNVNALFEDSLGRIWAGTEDDNVACFDGNRFFSLREFGSLRGVAAFAEDEQGGIWMGGSDGLYRFYRGQLQRLVQGHVFSVVRAAPGIILAALALPGVSLTAVRSMYRVRAAQGRWTAELIPGLRSMGLLSVDSQGRILFADGEAWYEVSPTDLTRWVPGNSLPASRHVFTETTEISTVLRDRYGCLWFRNVGIVMYQCPQDARPQLVPLGIASSHLRVFMREGMDGRMVLPSVASLGIGRPGNFQVARAANGLPAISDALIARDGSIWIGGPKGLFRFAVPFRMEFWNERDGLTAGGTALHYGNRIFAADGDGVKVLDHDREHWSRLPLLPDLGDANHLLPDGKGGFFVALGHHGAAQIRTDGSVIRPPPRELQSGMRLARTSDGQFWLAAYAVQRIVPGVGPIELRDEEDLPPMRTQGLDAEVDKTGKLWACYDRGLISREKSGWRIINHEDGLMENGCRSLAIHPNGDIWYGYMTMPAFSLVRFRADGVPQIRHYRAGGEVGNPSVQFLDVDSRGWIWRGGVDGVYVANPEQAERGQWVHLNNNDGLPAVSTNQQSFYQDPDGSVWFSADNSLVHFDPPADLIQPTRVPDVFISGFSFDGRAPRMLETVGEFPHGSKITAHIGSLQLAYRNALRIRYRLLPAQQSWKDGQNLDLDLGAVRSGQHALEVQARLADAAWSAAINYSFLIPQPLWLSWQALSAFATIGVLGIAGGRTWLLHRAERAKRALPDLSEARMFALIPEVQELQDSTLDSRYCVDRVLARGGFATVLEGRDLGRGGARCAIKVFRQELLADTSVAARFQQEVAALEKLHHPNIVCIYGHGTVPDGAPYLVMEFIQGKTLREMLEAGPIPPRRTASLLRQAGRALGEIHARGIYHRDIKPENMIVRAESAPGEDLVLIDFSIAIVKDLDPMLTGLSRAAGTKHYMAPEHAIGYADATTDIYNLSKVVIEMLMDKPLASLLRGPSLDLSSRVREFLFQLALPSRTVGLLCAALAFDPSQRPQSALTFADSIADDLESIELD